MVEVPMDCENIVKRVYTNQKIEKDLENPIAFIRNVYTIYEFQEILLSSIYHPSNTYCYSVDINSKTGIFEKLQKLSRCLPNVILNPVKYDFDSAGHFQDRANFKCLELILERKWYHAIFLQNNDLVLKSVEELAELSNLLNYTSMISFLNTPENRYIHNADWTPAGLKLFKNEAEVAVDILHKPLKIWMGSNQNVLSKTFAKSIFEKLNLEGILNRFDQKEIYGVDEMFVQTLYRNNLGLEGQPTSDCSSIVANFMRFVDWQVNPTFFNSKCKSRISRHAVCILGVEYLQDFTESNFVIANKILENFDLAPLICMKQIDEERKIRGKKTSRRDLQGYPQFREMEMRENGSYNKYDFRC